MRDKSVAQERESSTSLFQPDVLAAAQYMTKWRNQRNPEPEKMLMYAVLEDAITCFQRFSSASGARGRAAFNDAENWLMHEKSDWFFSFEPICEALSLNPDYIRAGLLHWRRTAPGRQRKIRLSHVVRAGRRARKAM